jgi:uncharacterized protein (DUF342 family)
MPVVKGNLKLEIDELGLEARITIIPDPNGAEISSDVVQAIMTEKGIKHGIENEEIDRAFRTLTRKREPLTFSAARGIPAVAAQPEGIIIDPFSLPDDLKALSEKVLAPAPAPEIYLIREERIKVEKTGQKKAGLPFLRSREEKEVSWETRTVRKRISADPGVSGVGYAQKDAVVGRVQPAIPGKDGKSIYGRVISADRSRKSDFGLGSNLRLAGIEVRADVSGFLRRGANWCDLVPYQRSGFTLFTDGATCLLSFTPGGDGPGSVSARSVIEEAERLGFRRDALLPEAEIQAILRQVISSGVSLDKKPISPSADALVAVTVSPDKLRATITIRKGKGGGRKLNLAEISEAIRKSGIKGFNAEIVKKDILGFNSGNQVSLEDYTLVVGQPAEKGEDGKLEWLVAMMKGEEAASIRKASQENASLLEDIPSISEFPLESVESVGRVEEGTEILRIVQPGMGKPGIDVYKSGIPGIKGAEPKVKLFENLKRKKDLVVAGLDGIVEKATRDGVLFLRVRPHRDVELEVTISEDRMKGFITCRPPQGTGRGIGPDEVKAAIEKQGIVQGVKSDALLEALDSISKSLPVTNLLVAEGKPPKGAEERKLVFHVQLASGRRVLLRDDGKADFKNQDTMTQVSKGDHLATLPPPGQGVEEGWDITGKTIAPGSREEQVLQAGRNVRIDEQDDGGAKFFADADGELFYERNVLEVKELHTVASDVDLTTGNVKFKGKVHVKGSVLSGFTIVAGDDAVIDEVIQAAFISSDGSIVVGQGIKGEGRAILRARRDIKASFAEQAVLLSNGDIRVKSGCLHCQIKCNGRLLLESEKGNLMGGKTRVKLGASLQNLGSPGGARTEISFGQDYVVKDQLDKEQKTVDILKQRILELDSRMKRLERFGAGQRRALEEARADKLVSLRELENRSLRLLGLRDKFEEHFSSEVVVRGTMYPGAVVESHGRFFVVKAEKTRIALYFDASLGRILEKPAK